MKIEAEFWDQGVAGSSPVAPTFFVLRIPEGLVRASTRLSETDQNITLTDAPVQPVSGEPGCKRRRNGLGVSSPLPQYLMHTQGLQR